MQRATTGQEAGCAARSRPGPGRLPGPSWTSPRKSSPPGASRQPSGTWRFSPCRAVSDLSNAPRRGPLAREHSIKLLKILIFLPVIHRIATIMNDETPSRATENRSRGAISDIAQLRGSGGAQPRRRPLLSTERRACRAGRSSCRYLSTTRCRARSCRWGEGRSAPGMSEGDCVRPRPVSDLPGRAFSCARRAPA